MQTLNLRPINFIGSHRTERFATDSHNISRLITGTKNYSFSKLASKKRDFANYSILNLTLFVKIVKEVEYVI